MRILYLGYWGIADGLSVATVYPHLRILSEMPAVEQVWYCSIERDQYTPVDLQLPKVQHIPLFSGHSWKDKFNDFTIFPAQLSRLVKEHQIDRLICRGAPAGGIGHWVHKATGVPYLVESFEPHAEYMRASGIWPWWHPKYWVERLIEVKQKQTASLLVTVSENYKQKLLQEGISEARIRVAPCSVDADRFAFSAEDREAVRMRLGIAPNQLVGIYVGKFGGIYFEEEAIQFFQEAFAYWPQLFVIILTPNPNSVAEWLGTHGLPMSQIHCTSVPHREVPSYLSAADMAFSLIRPAEARRYCSPIKNGEYWANGLPILTPKDIGDDSHLLEVHAHAGVVFDLHTVGQELKRMDALAKTRTMDHGRISELAHRYRSVQAIYGVYKDML